MKRAAQTGLRVLAAGLAAGLTALGDGSAVFNRELLLLGGYAEQGGWITESGHHLKNGVGAEYLRKFSGATGDFLTLDLQARATYDSRAEGADRWALELHNAWLEYKPGLGHNLRAGHFAPAYGLEPTVDTHGTLFQTLQEADIGFKSDWGVAYRGLLGPADWETALQTGSGMGLAHKDGSGLLSSRLGFGAGQEWQTGVSALFGNVLMAEPMRTIPAPHYHDEALRLWRVGGDTQLLWGPWLWRGEVSLGQNENNDVVGLLGEANYTIPSWQACMLTVQARYWADEPGDHLHETSQLGVGAAWALTRAWTLRTAVVHDHVEMDRQNTYALVQAYYFGS